MSIFLNNTDFRFQLSAPSWVISGTIFENCRFLEGKVDEIALLFFETESCLAYTKTDLPEELIDTGLAFHIHHPLDLPWEEGGGRVAEIVIALNEKAAHLNPTAHVVHPPSMGPEAAGLIREFAAVVSRGGVRPETILLENIKENSLLGLTRVIADCGMKICLDLGHILAYAQHDLLRDPDLDGQVAMLHLNAPGPKGRHLGLDHLNSDGFETLDVLFEKLNKGGTVTVEVFEEESFFNSLQLLSDYCTARKIK
ncbi:cobamide remodeling phosphodiesterase CbiR [Maridesulfovibrio sp.]|uniref:cobamide remodeling phosphodiesterase CbiR n=1 Tax=Maridesulfovibrio sp. TaxID=2795000 RepID=UPI002A18A2E0|nr:cobamide remodeling phosphodiesterase CbiR [Maridesulfovibrio sp.]